MPARRTGPPLPELLILLAPLAKTLEKLFLNWNKLGGTITADIAAFGKLTELCLVDMALRGARARAKNRPVEKSEWG